MNRFIDLGKRLNEPIEPQIEEGRSCWAYILPVSLSGEGTADIDAKEKCRLWMKTVVDLLS